MTNVLKARDAEFIAKCKQLIRRRNLAGEKVNLYDVINEVVNSRPRCHYANYDTASRILHAIERGGADCAGRGLQRLKWIELYNQVRETIDGPRRLTFDKALSFVLSFRRPSRFYIDPIRAARILRPHIRVMYMLG